MIQYIIFYVYFCVITVVFFPFFFVNIIRDTMTPLVKTKLRRGQRHEINDYITFIKRSIISIM